MVCNMDYGQWFLDIIPLDIIPLDIIPLDIIPIAPLFKAR